MSSYEYAVIPAPGRAEKVRGARTGVERFSWTLASEMNRMAADGWEYVRAEVLPCEERSGLTSRQTVYHNVLVFRRELETEEFYEEPPVAAQTQQQAAVQPAAPTAVSHAAASSTATATTQPSEPVQEPPADWPDAGAAVQQPEPEDDLSDMGIVAEPTSPTPVIPPGGPKAAPDYTDAPRPKTRTGIFSTAMTAQDADRPAHRLGPAKR